MLIRALVPRRISFRSKPRLGLSERDIVEWRFDPIAFLMIGDDQDLDAVAAAGIRGICLKGGSLLDCLSGAFA